MLITVPAAAAINNFALAYIVAGVIDRLSRGTVPLSQVWSVFGDDIIAFAACVVVGELVLFRLNVLLLWTLEAKMVQRLYDDAFDHLTSQSATFFSDRFVGSLVSTVNKYTGAYVVAADTVVFQVIPLLVVIIVPIVVLGPVVPLYAVGIAVVTTVFVIFTLLSYRPIQRVAQVESEAHTAIGGRLSDVLSNVLVVKSFGREIPEQRGFSERTTAHRRATFRLLQRHLLRDFGFGSLLSLLLAVTLATILVGQASGLSIGTLIVMLTFTLSMFGNLWELPQVTRHYNRVFGDASPMMDLYAVAPSVVDPQRPEHPRIQAGHIVFDSLGFTYPGAGRPLFDGLSLDIQPGERVGLVGPSGSGKSTVTKLVMRFFDVDTGEVRIDGQNVVGITQQALRSRIAFVPQEPLLFHRSIAENIRYGRPGATDAEVALAAQRAQVLEFTQDLDAGLETLVGERGVKLSGGQRQRIAIARAILSDAPILVLDEATSALDSLSEAKISAALEEAMAGRTTIAIAHRLSTLRSMSRLVVLDRGRVVEDGPHEVLVGLDGVYAAMWHRQSGGFVTV